MALGRLRAVWPQRSARNFAELPASVDIFDHSLVKTRQVLVAVLKHGLQAKRHTTGAHFVRCNHSPLFQV